MAWNGQRVVLGLAGVVAAVSPVPVWADTPVGGFITTNTSWTEAGSPYVLSLGSVIVNEGVTLTVEPGVTVRAPSDRGIQVKGAILARGTLAKPILFTSDAATPAKGDWNGIELTSTCLDAVYDGDGNYQSGSVFEHVTIEYAGQTQNGALLMSNAHPFISHVTFRHNGKGGLRAGNLSETLKVLDCTFDDNSTADASGGGGLLLAESNSSPVVYVVGNTFTGNNASPGGGMSWQAYTDQSGKTPVLYVRNNLFDGNRAWDKGCAVSVNHDTWGPPANSPFKFEFTDNVVTNNESNSERYGGCIQVDVDNTGTTNTVLVARNTISDNRKWGLYTSLGRSNLVVEDNLVTGNHGGGIKVTNHDQWHAATIRRNTVLGNTAVAHDDSAGGGVYASGGIVTVESNNIVGNTAYLGGAIYRGHNYDLFVLDNYIADNVATGEGGGLYCCYDSGEGKALAVRRNQVTGNRADVTGGGLHLATRATTNMTILDNAITNNGAPTGSALHYGYAEVTDELARNVIVGNKATGTSPTSTIYLKADGTNRAQPSIHHNSIYGNTATYDLYNSNPDPADVSAENNWWGVDDMNGVEARVFHKIDSSTRSVVDYDPWLTAMGSDVGIAPFLGFTVLNATTERIQLQWTANGESDLAGYLLSFRADGAPAWETRDLGNVTSYDLTGILPASYRIGLAAYDSDYAAAADLPSTPVDENRVNGHLSGSSWVTAVTDLTVDPYGHDFGDVNTGDAPLRLFTVKNTGTVGFTLGTLALSGGGASAFALEGDQCSTQTLAGATQCTFQARFSPTAGGLKEAVVTVPLDTTPARNVTVNLRGTGVAVANIGVSPASVEFGTVLLGSTPAQVLTVTNTGVAVLTVTGVSLVGAHAASFSIQDDCTSLAAGGTCTVSVVAALPAAGARTASVEIRSDDPTEPIVTVPVTATGAVPLGVQAMTASPTYGVAPLPVQFTALGTGGSGSFTYAWDFDNDGTPDGTGTPVSHTYTTPGTYTAKVTVADQANGASTSSGTITVTVVAAPNPPVSITSLATSVAYGQAPLASQFQVTAAGGSGTFSYAWDFDDGATSTEEDPSHSFTTAGTYDVTVTVSDTSDVSNHAVGQVTVTVVEPPATQTRVGISALSATPAAGLAPLQVEFAVTATGGSGTYTYAWDFGDTTNGTGNAPTHTYTAAGTYQVTVTVTDTANANHHATGHLTVTAVGAAQVPVGIAALGATPGAGTAPLQVAFSVTATGGSGTYTYAWTFGDGGTSAVVAPSHTFAAAGTYQVEVTVTDAADDSQHATGRLTVTAVAPFVAPVGVQGLRATPVNGPAPLSVSFQVTGTGGSGSYAYDWTFGDGDASNLQNPTHVYAEAGPYTAVVTVTDTADSSRTARALLAIVAGERPAPINVTLSADVVSGQAPLTVSFHAAITGSAPPYDVKYVFGDGTSITRQVTGGSDDIDHVYSSGGNYLVTVEVRRGVDFGTQSQPISVGTAVEVTSAKEEEEKCGCQTAGAAGGGPAWVVFLGLVAAWSSRRRVRR
jgi:MYXO-CTERM domain-containing protein